MPGFHPKRILVVEDDPMAAMLTSEMLRDLGHWVVGPCHNLEDGLAAVTAGGIDIALLDFALGPDTDAVPIAQALAEKQVPFAFATGKDLDGISALYSGRPVISKPVAPSEIQAVIVGLTGSGALH